MRKKCAKCEKRAYNLLQWNNMYNIILIIYYPSSNQEYKVTNVINKYNISYIVYAERAYIYIYRTWMHYKFKISKLLATL